MSIQGVPGAGSGAVPAGMADASHSAHAHNQSYSAENLAEYKLTHPSRWARVLKWFRRSAD